MKKGWTKVKRKIKRMPIDNSPEAIRKRMEEHQKQRNIKGEFLHRIIKSPPVRG